MRFWFLNFDIVSNFEIRISSFQLESSQVERELRK